MYRVVRVGFRRGSMYLHAYNSVVIARVEAINLSHYTVLGTIALAPKCLQDHMRNFKMKSDAKSDETPSRCFTPLRLTDHVTVLRGEQ